ncbi:MAG: glycosyltransferase family 9 protein [Flavobacteriia bacterium]
MNRFLVIQTAFIGDVILATPVVSELKRIYPNAQIDVLVRKGNESLLANNPKISSVFTFNKKEGKFNSMMSLIKLFRKNKYDEVINLHRFASSGLIAVFSGAKLKVGFSKNPLSFLYSRKIKHEIGNGLHEVERNLLCIKHHGADSNLRPEIFPSVEDYKMVEAFQNSNYYCLAPASIWFTKQLPENKWIELAQKLSQKAKVYFVGGPSDFDLCERLSQAVKHQNCENIAGKFTFLQSSALFKKAEMNYVNDSGPLHFCSAVNAPVRAFFCSTTPKFGFGPLSDDSQTIESLENLDCKPCGLHGFTTCPKGHFKCGNTIKIDKVN